MARGFPGAFFDGRVVHNPLRVNHSRDPKTKCQHHIEKSLTGLSAQENNKRRTEDRENLHYCDYTGVASSQQVCPQNLPLFRFHFLTQVQMASYPGALFLQGFNPIYQPVILSGRGQCLYPRTLRRSIRRQSHGARRPPGHRLRRRPCGLSESPGTALVSTD